jgi:hypothetical protein
MKTQITAKNPRYVFVQSRFDGRWRKEKIGSDKPAREIGSFEFLPAYIQRLVPWENRPLKIS